MPGVYDDDDAKREILTLAFGNHVQYLRWLSQIDLRMFGGFLTLQLVLGGWLLQYPPVRASATSGILIIDVVLAFAASVFLIKNQVRRKREVTTLGNISEALGLTKEGYFLENKKIMESPQSDPSLWLYLLAIGTSVIGIALIILPGLTGGSS